MAIYVGVTQNPESTRQYLIEQKSGMYPDIVMGPFRREVDAINYITFMQDRFPGAVEVKIPDVSVPYENHNKWWVFSFEHDGQVH